MSSNGLCHWLYMPHVYCTGVPPKAKGDGVNDEKEALAMYFLSHSVYSSSIEHGFLFCQWVQLGVFLAIAKPRFRPLPPRGAVHHMVFGWLQHCRDWGS